MINQLGMSECMEYPTPMEATCKLDRLATNADKELMDPTRLYLKRPRGYGILYDSLESIVSTIAYSDSDWDRIS